MPLATWNLCEGHKQIDMSVCHFDIKNSLEICAPRQLEGIGNMFITKTVQKSGIFVFLP